jgi:putative flippase GtrA
LNPPLLLRHWLKFNAVGAIGIVVQLAALAILKGLLHMEYLAATAVAVEIAVLHNFMWHERWTWADRVAAKGEVRLLWVRLVRFNLSTGVVSIAANLLFMRLLVGQLHVQYLAANILSIAAASLANFLLSDLFVFRDADLL